jgi:hypothetical protein
MNDSEIEQTLKQWRVRTPSARLRSAIFDQRSAQGERRAASEEGLAAWFPFGDRRLWATLSGTAAATACLALVTFFQMDLPGGVMVVGGRGTNGLLASNLLAVSLLDRSAPGFDSQQVNVWSQATLASTNLMPGH